MRLSLVLLCRQYRLERELKSLLWKIDYNELCFEKKRNSITSLGSQVVRAHSLGSDLVRDPTTHPPIHPSVRPPVLLSVCCQVSSPLLSSPLLSSPLLSSPLLSSPLLSSPLLSSPLLSSPLLSSPLLSSPLLSSPLLSSPTLSYLSVLSFPQPPNPTQLTYNRKSFAYIY